LLTLLLGSGVGSWVVPACDATGDGQRETLQRLPGVWVVVEQVAPELAQGGLTAAAIQRETEETLHAAGLRLLSAEECWQTPGMPWLYITVALLKATETTYAATIAAVLHQEVQLTRLPQLKTFGVTWDAGTHVGAVSTEELPSIRRNIRALIDKFVEEYQAVNP
jgi:hypothetical protein